jgi:hypothetical protein
VGKPEGKRPLGRPRYRPMNDIKVGLEWDGVDGIGLAVDRDKWRTLANAVMNLRVPLNCLSYFRIVIHTSWNRFKVFTAVSMKNSVLWDVTPCVSCNNRRFASVVWLLVTANVIHIFTDSCLPDGGGYTSFRNVGSYK